MESKNSFILYCDLIHTVEKMPDDKAGELFKHILKYVNDLNPETDDLIIQLTFEPIKQQLKRDLSKWSNYIEKQKVNGAKGGRPKNPTESQETQAFSEKPKKADNASVSVSVSVNDNVNESDIKKKEVKEKSFTPPELSELENYFIENGYSKESAKKAFDYYSVANWKDSGGKQVKNWKQKMISVWFKDENKEKQKSWGL